MPDLVVARYNEDLQWLADVPSNYRIIIYNKGDVLPNMRCLRRVATIMTLPNIGREADTYLRHMLLYMKDVSLEDYTIFTQGNPFPHSPYFIKNLEKGRLSTSHPWGCSAVYDDKIPPQPIVHKLKDKHIYLRNEFYSLYNWEPPNFFDEFALWLSINYMKMFKVPNGTNFVADFFRRVGMEEMEMKARRAIWGEFSYGALFGVSNRDVRNVEPRSLLKILKIHHFSEMLGDGLIGNVLERLWLHIFGLPFPEESKIKSRIILENNGR